MVNQADTLNHTALPSQESGVGNQVKPIWLAKKQSLKIYGFEPFRESI
jgi:hypothetical protein